MSQDSVVTYKCDRCGKTAPEEPVPPGVMSPGGTAPTGWNNLQLRNLRDYTTKTADVCDTCTTAIMPDMWVAKPAAPA